MNPAIRTLPRIAPALIAAIGLPTAAFAQQLWNLEAVTAQPATPIVMDGLAISVAAASAPTGEAAAVQVTFDYLRVGMGYLELPLMDGSVIQAENAVFEDRGNGNLMWTGEVPGAGYESVVLTVQDGHLVGWFGEPGGPKYVVYAGPDGSGSLAVELGPTGDWCGVEARPGRDLVHDAAQTTDRLASVTSQSSDDRLDILVLYPEETEHYWRRIGGPTVGVRQLGDYLNMVFRNGAIKATANLIPVRWDPKLPNHPRTQGGHQNSRYWHGGFSSDAEVAALRRSHKPDLIHFIPDVGTSGAAGLSGLRWNLNLYVVSGWSIPSGTVFAHEIGHGLGGFHEPITLGDRFEEVQSEFFWPYAFGHTDMTSCAKREGYGDRLLCPSTTMSYGWDASRDDDPKTWAVTEPFYSSVRHKPNGWTIGVAGTSEVERVFHETASVQARSGEAPWRAEQYPRSVVGVRWTGHDTVRVTWSGDWRSQDGGGVDFVLAEGAYDFYQWSWDRASSPENPPLDEERSDANVTPIVRADGVQVGVEVAGLRPGGRYRVSVLGAGRSVDGEYIRSLSSDIFHLKPRARVSGSPAAASQIGAQVTSPGSVRLYWRDNSRVETGYEVWQRKWSGDEPDEIWSRFGEPLPASTRNVDVVGLTAEDEIQITDSYYDYKKDVWVQGQNAKVGRYSFVVVAYNDRGWNASETFHLEFMPGEQPEPTTVGELTDCYLWSRPTGIDLDGYRVDACLETPDGARRRVWDYQLEADQSGLLYFFDRDNAEILVKVLDGCAINGHRWVFLAPVTTLPFRLVIREPGPYIANRRRIWYYDSERRPQDRIQRLGGRVGNPKDRTARTVSDTTAFPCTTAEIAAAKAAAASTAADPEWGNAHLAEPSSATRLTAGARTECEPGEPVLTLRGGYTVSMCYETGDGRVGSVRDWGLDSSQSGLLYFFERNNAEVLIKVLDGCGVNGHRWVFVAPVTDLAFNLHVESHNGRRWIHRNPLGQTADAAADVSAFACADDDAVTVSIDAASADEGDAVRFPVTLSAPAASDIVLRWSTSAGTATAGDDFTAVTTGTLRISAGETTGTLRVATIEDAIAEGDETFTVRLIGTTLPPGVVLAADRAVGTIVDDEEPIEITVSETASANEGDPIEFAVTLSGPAGGDTVLGWRTSAGTATAGEDFTAVTEGTLRISAGKTTGTLRVATTEDDIPESDETFTVTLKETTLPPGVILVANQAVGTIVDDDWEPLDIPDANLRRAIKDALGLAEGTPITQLRLERLTRLVARESGIRDLTGLDYATNLTWLDLYDNEIGNASPLAGLTNLTQLHLGSNGISDISPLSGLNKLTGLYLGSNGISDISPLSGLNKLTGLYLGSNGISDISPLSGLNKLTYLTLSFNSISDISPLAGLTSLTSLQLPGNSITDISPLAGLTKLTYLTLSFNSISDISPLSGLASLIKLDIRGNCLDRASLDVHVPALQSRGVEVLFDTTCASMSTTDLRGSRGGRPARPPRP